MAEISLPGPNKNAVWRYGVTCYGIKKRCRKYDLHMAGGRIGLGESHEPDEKTARALASDWITRNMKTAVKGKAYATATLWTYDPDTGLEQWQPMNPDHNLRFPL